MLKFLTVILFFGVGTTFYFFVGALITSLIEARVGREEGLEGCAQILLWPAFVGMFLGLTFASKIKDGLSSRLQ